MKLRTRLTIAGTVVVGLMAIGISATALISAQNSEIARLDQSLAYIASEASGAKADAVDKALVLASDSAIGVTVGIATTDGEWTVVNESLLVLEGAPAPDLLQLGTKTDVEVNGEPHFLMRTVELDPNSYLVLATSLTAVDSNRSDNLTKFAWLTLIGVLLAAIALRVIIRRDLRVIDSLIDAAEEVSEGEMATVIPAAGGNAEVDQLAAALRRMVSSLQHSLEVEQATQVRMQQFLGDASHELRTPLTVIRGYVELLSTADDLPAEQRERAYTRLASEIHRMEALIKDLLLLAELGDSSRAEFESVNLSDLVDIAVDDLRVLEADRRIEAAVDADVMITGSKHLLEQLLANLTGNIRRHTPADAPVRIRLIDHPDHSNLTVEDGGPGLSDEALQRGIQHFQRFDSARSRESGGSGLGMSIMAGIVDSHAGRIRLGRSDLGGLAVEITLPHS